MAPLRSVRSPGWAPAPEAPVALLLHGFGSHEHDLPGLARFLPAGLSWASLRAPLEMGGGAAAWFPLSPAGEMDDAQIASSTEAVWAWVDAEVGESATVVPLGFSQGGLMALQLLRTRPDRVLAPVVLAGFVPRGSRPGDPEVAARRPDVFWGRGDSDPVIWPDAIARTRDFLATHTNATTRLYAGLGHSVSEDELEDVREFLAARL